MSAVSPVSQYFTALDGLRLHVRRHKPDASSDIPVLCLPGLTRSHRDFDDLAEHLASDPVNPRDVLCLDYRGRGLSDYDKTWENYTVFQELADVQAVLTACNIHRAHFIGTSRGGLLIMLMAASRPGALASATLNDVGPVIETTGLVRIKRMLAELREPKDWDDAKGLVMRYGKPMFPGFSDQDWAKFARQTFGEKEGHPAIDFDRKLEKLLDAIGTGTPPVQLWPQFEGLKPVKTLCIRGALSALLLSETVEKMQDTHPAFSSIEIPDQGHAPVLWDKHLLTAISSHLKDAEKAHRA